MTDQGEASSAQVHRGLLTRRRLVQAVGALGGAGIALGSMEALGLAPDIRRHTRAFQPPRSSDFHLQGRVNGTTVLVLGAGDAGLVTAYELEQAGYRCELLEARDRPGGRCWTVRGGQRDTDAQSRSQTARFSDGHYFNAGPARIPQHHTTLEYCRELGVPIEVFVNSNPDAYVYNEPTPDTTGALTGRPLPRRAVRADVNGYVAELLAKSTRQAALDDELTTDDREALVEYLRSFGSLSTGDRYTGSPQRGYREPPAAADRAGTLDPPYALHDLLAARLGTYFAFDDEWDQSMPMFQPVGGMDRIPYALSRAIRGIIRYGAAVRRISVGSDEVVVDYADHDGTTWRTRADYCVCSIPPSVLTGVTNNFPARVTSALAGLQTMPVGKIGLEFRRRFWEEDDRILGGITDTNLDIGTIFYPSYGYHSDRGVLVGYYTYFDTSLRLAAMSPSQRAAHAVEQGAKIHGRAYRDEFANAFSVHWQDQPYSRGGWVLWPDRSQSSAYRTLLQPVGRLCFAGDHLSYVTAWQHGAIESARYAVTRLHQRVLAEDRA